MTALDLLAFDTSTELGSIAVSLGGGIASRRFLVDRRGHAASLIPAISDALEEAGRSLSELDGVVVGSGPGSFTGVRVAAATAKGLVHALNVPLWSFSSLAAAAVSGDVPPPEGVEGDGGPRWAPESAGSTDLPHYVLFDARQDRVYAACYRLSPRTLEILVPPCASTIPRILRGGIPAYAVFCGNGALRHRGRLEEAGHVVLGPPAGLPTADGLIRLRELISEARPIGDPGRWEPDYLKPSSAQRISDG